MPTYFNPQDDDNTPLNEYKNIPTKFENFFYMCTGDYKFSKNDSILLRIISFPSRLICKTISLIKRLL